MLIVEANFVIALDLPEPVCADSDDDKFLECALAGKAKILVSGDKHLLGVSGYRSLEIVIPRQFVDEFFK